MKRLIITNVTGVSLQFDDYIKNGEILLRYEDSGLSSSHTFSNTNFVMLAAKHFKNRGNIELKVIIENKTVAKKRITNYTLINKQP